MSYRFKRLGFYKASFINSKEKYIKELVWIFVGQAAMIILSIISIKLLTTMPKAEFGKYNLVLSLAALSSSILYGPAEQGFIRFYFEYKKLGIEYLFFRTIIKFLMYAAGLIFLLFFIFYLANFFLLGNQLTFFDFKIPDLLTVIVFIALFSSNVIFNSILNLLRKRQLNTLFSIVEKIIGLALISSIIFFSKLNAQLVLLSLASVILIFLILKYLKIRKLFSESDTSISEVRIQNSQKLKREIFTFCLPFLFWGITGWIQVSSDKFIISNYLNVSNVGIYSLVFAMTSYLISTPINIISQFIQPVIYEKILGSSEARDIRHGYKLLNYALILIIMLIGTLCIFTLFFGDFLILLISNSSYLYHVNLLPLLCLGVGIFQLAQFYITFGIIKNKPNIYLPAKLISGILAVILNVYLIGRYQLLGIAIALLLVSTVFFFLVIYANHKIGIKLFSRHGL